MKTIGTNSIRIYHVDPNGSHDGCMKAFSDAGIYTWIDLDTFDTQITEAAPKWSTGQRDAYAKVMDTFHSYDNVAGFFIGNEAITSRMFVTLQSTESTLTCTANGSVTAPYIKAAARDLKAYRDSKGYRKIPIGYSAADIASMRPMLQNYLACGTNTSEALDFFSVNSYSWCGDSDYQTSGYVSLRENALGYNIPIFMSETGCQVPRPRTFQDQTALFGEMADTWSGSMVYEWIEEANNYGLIRYGDKVDPSMAPDGWPRSGTPIPMQPDFGNLAAVWKTVSAAGVKMSAYTNTPTPIACPAYTASKWEVHPEAALPTLGQTHDFAAPQPSGTPSRSGGAPAQQSGTGAAAASPTSSQGAAPDNLGRDLKSVGAMLAGVFALFAWL